VTGSEVRAEVRAKLGDASARVTDVEIDAEAELWAGRLDQVDQTKFRLLRRLRDPSTDTTARRRFP